jgi:hypothetical protein
LHTPRKFACLGTDPCVIFRNQTWTDAALNDAVSTWISDWDRNTLKTDNWSESD